MRHSVLACMLLFIICSNALAEDAQAILPIEGPLQCVDKDDNPAMFLVIEVTIPNLFTNKQYKFPLKRKTPIQSDEAGYPINLGNICPVFGGGGDSMDLSEHYHWTVSLDRICADSARIDLSFHWTTAKGKGIFEKRLTVPLFRRHEYSYRSGIKIRTYPRI